MKYGICPFSVVPLRVSAVDTSEICTQLLFGEMAEVLEKKDKSWLKVRCQNDNTIAWMHTDQLHPVTAEEFELYNNDFSYCLDLVQPVVANDHFLLITLGARLPLFDGLKCQFGDRTYQFSGQAVDPQQLKADADLLEKLARRYLYAPYLHGGRSPLGIDSAGLVQLLFQMVHISLPRRASQQIHYGEAIDFVDQSQPGDLAFFENRAGRITHVGMVLQETQILHAADCVRIDRLDHFGIFNEDRQLYTHKLRVVRRLLPVYNKLRPSIKVVPEVQKEQMQLFERTLFAE
ncbi:MAG: C40 family peptidase [Bacteroidota bacterium]